MFSDAERMEVRSYVQLAGEAIAQYWPMRTFIHHNPLHGLEDLPFDQAVKRGEQLFGGRGYLPNGAYRRYFEQGLIRTEDLTEVLSSIATGTQVVFAGRTLSHLEVLRLSMIHGLGELAAEPSGASSRTEQELDRLAVWLNASLGPGFGPSPEPLAQWESIELLSKETLSAWCDQTLGTTLVATINEQLIKWCSVFLDEGEASWVMPRRDQTFYRAWKALARY
ncbi:MAG TPA: putative inorganic carbon transporter subunit DabA, partial [Nitrospiraceae bacterium]|nr:putative inorganic carbon transporter subunit DabA [Nitrospiraceae bacterium]